MVNRGVGVGEVNKEGIGALAFPQSCFYCLVEGEDVPVRTPVVDEATLRRAEDGVGCDVVLKAVRKDGLEDLIGEADERYWSIVRWLACVENCRSATRFKCPVNERIGGLIYLRRLGDRVNSSVAK